MDKRLQLNKERRKRIKSLVKREQKSAYKILIFSMIAGILNYIFWHDQFIGLDLKYNLVFIVMPLVVGLYFYSLTNKYLIRDIFATKAIVWWDSLLSSLFLLLIALFFAYFSAVTVANAIFKATINIYTKDRPFVYKTYTVTATSKNNKGKGIHLFSHIYYIDEDDKKQIFDVRVNEVETSDERRKITFKCQQGFWNYYKILDYQLE